MIDTRNELDRIDEKERKGEPILVVIDRRNARKLKDKRIQQYITRKKRNNRLLIYRSLWGSLIEFQRCKAQPNSCCIGGVVVDADLLKY